MRAIVRLSAVVILVLGCSVVIAEEAPDRPGALPVPSPFPEPEPERPGLIGSVTRSITNYTYNRVRDFADIFTIRLGWGTGRSIGFQARLARPIQIGAGMFEGTVLAIDRGHIGIMKEVEIEGGISFFYPSYQARKVTWQTAEAERRNIFFGDLGEDHGEITLDDLKMYDDGNRPWLSSTAKAQLPYLPKVELTINWGEIPDFVLSFIPIRGLRVPPPYHLQDGPGDERIPAPSILWHGQEEYHTYE